MLDLSRRHVFYGCFYYTSSCTKGLFMKLQVFDHYLKVLPNPEIVVPMSLITMKINKLVACEKTEGAHNNNVQILFEDKMYLGVVR